MDRYIGLDVHAQSSTLAVLSPTGKRVACKVVETSAAALIAALKEISGRRHLCLEEGTQSDWLQEVLEPHVARVGGDGSEGEEGTNKSDEADAWSRAEELRGGKLETKVFKAPKSFGGLRDAVRSQWMLTQDTTPGEESTEGHLPLARSCEHWRETSTTSEKRHQWAGAAASEQAAKSGTTGAAVGPAAAVAPGGAASGSREEANSGHAALRWVKTVPGLGPIRSAQVVATVVTPHRFRTRRQFWKPLRVGRGDQVVSRTGCPSLVAAGCAHSERSRGDSTATASRS